jgi:DNA-binding transcriptional ArsR family regulator
MRKELVQRCGMADSTAAARDELARARRLVARVEAGVDQARVREVLCEPARLRIISALEGGRLPVGELAAVIERRVPATSQHLRILRGLGLVEARRAGSHVYYGLRPGPVTAQLRAVLAAVCKPPRPGA